MKKHNFIAVTFFGRLLPFMIYEFKKKIHLLNEWIKKSEKIHKE